MTHWTETVYREDSGIFRRHLEQRVDDAESETDDLLALAADHGVEPATALDVACGIGRHAVGLANRGVAVLGIDISEPYLDRARERAAAADVAAAVDFERRDMRDLDGSRNGDGADGEYDLVYNLWTSFGYYDDETNRSILRGMYDRMAADGALVIELVNRDAVLAEFSPAHVPEDDDEMVVETHSYDPATARMSTTRRIFDETEDGYEYAGEMEYEVRLYSPVELAELCRDVGFEEVSLYGGLDGEELQRDSSRLVVVAEP